MSSFHHAKVWSPKTRQSARTDGPPYVYLASTWRHSRDKCSQAFPALIFVNLPIPWIIVNANGRSKQGRPGTEAISGKGGPLGMEHSSSSTASPTQGNLMKIHTHSGFIPYGSSKEYSHSYLICQPLVVMTDSTKFLTDIFKEKWTDGDWPFSGTNQAMKTHINDFWQTD